MITNPTPGFNGTYADTCAACLRPTDTALAFEGDGEFMIASLMQFEMSINDAASTLCAATGCDEGMVPVGTFTTILRICQKCANEAGFCSPALLFADAEIPLYTQAEAA